MFLAILVFRVLLGAFITFQLYYYLFSYMPHHLKTSIQTMECYPELKINEPSSYEETWRKLKCMFLRKKRQSEMAPYSVIPTLWHSVKGRTMETVKDQWRPGFGGSSGVGNASGAQRTLGQWVYPVWYSNGRHVLLYVCPNPENGQHQEWTLM